MIKKIKVKQSIALLLMLSLMIVTLVKPINTQAATTIENGWIAEYLSDYEPLQSLLEEYPDAKLVQNNTSYILNEAIKDEEGNVIQLNQKAFSNLSDMESYENATNRIVPDTVSPGETFYKEYSKIRMGLSLYKYSSSSFFVACTYDWLDGFDYDLLFDYKAVVGLAVGYDLSMEGSSYGGRVTMTTIGNTVIEKTTANGTLSIKPTSAYGIGYSIKQNAQTNGMLKDMQGVISCTAKKSEPSIENCPAYGEYCAVASTLNLNDFSVSIPAGISFSLPTVKTPYSIQDNLDIR